MPQPLTAAVRYLSGEREPVRVATTENIPLQGIFVIDDVDVEVGDRVLVKDQTDKTQNGIYLASEGAWFRAPDASYTRAIDSGVTVRVQEGTASNGKDFRFTAVRPVLGTDEITLEPIFAAFESALQSAVDQAENAADRADNAANGLTQTVNGAPNRQALASLDPAVLTTVYLKDGGREGQFVWRDGDFSGAVAVDPAQAIYIPRASNPSGSTGAWVRTGWDKLDIRWFGAVGDGAARPLSTQFATLADAQKYYPTATSLTQQVNDMALKAAHVLSLALGIPDSAFGPFDNAVPIYYPPGGYYHVDTPPLNGAVEICGAGKNISRLLFAGTHGLEFTHGAYEYSHIHDLDLLAAAPNAGTALSLSGFEGQNIRDDAVVTNVFIGTWGSNWWNNGVFMQNIGDAHFTKVRCQSSPASTANWMTAGFIIGYRCIDNHFTECSVQGAQYAVLNSGESCEGIRIQDCTFIAVKKGVSRTANVQRPHITIRGTHIASSNGCVDLQNISTVIISDCLFYLTNQADVPSPENSVCAYFNNCSGVTFVDTEMGGQDGAPYQYGVLISNSLNIKMTGLYFAFFDQAAWVQSTVVNGIFTFPRMFSCAAGLRNDSTTVTSLETITPFAKTILDDATASDARTTLGLGSIATQTSSSVAITGGSISGITDLALADGGTGASTAATARSNLGAWSKAGDGPLNINTGPGWNAVASLSTPAAQGASVTIGTGAGLVLVTETNSGNTALYLVANGVSAIVSQQGTLFLAGSTSAGKIGMLYDSGTGNFVLNNQVGSTVNLRTFAFRTGG